MVISMYVQKACVSNLWMLDTLGITDHIENVSKETRQAEIKAQFQDTVRIDSEGRYEVSLPWKENHPSLDDNRDVSRKRLEAVTKKL